MNNSAEAFFAAKLAFETDVSDVHAALESGRPGLILIDSRNTASWDQGHLPGAVHRPDPATLPRDAELVVYCWGPGCNGATKAALELARQGHRVREMIGGFEYWAREGFPVVTSTGEVTRPVDELTAPCGC
ncbi:rhodanese-like domain-containing protein [Actinoplanes sp. NBRC 101535]|uniref:rhodanese-like domain-containing protein n=1 Tax=Actinoplanes sp. NBRC 101535 TaxID=3032196 RepID=UPI0024A4CDC7|nr:rhodanese-like domain-containing protein [Actinoplanes sp. NBRC 101535]GLY01317.1 hypothetical protein Acsp01_16960 [Actinoplanes sp. NBRC 101535]